MEPFNAKSPPASSMTSKQRMRWTPELHEAFVEAINQLGGSERAYALFFSFSCLQNLAEQLIIILLAYNFKPQEPPLRLF